MSRSLDDGFVIRYLPDVLADEPEWRWQILQGGDIVERGEGHDLDSALAVSAAHVKAIRRDLESA
jgi:hypothetical protein